LYRAWVLFYWFGPEFGGKRGADRGSTVKVSTAAPVREPVTGLRVPTETRGSNEKVLASLRLLWEQRRFLFRVALYALIVSTVLAFLIPKEYESTARLMPPDNQSGSGLAMAAAAMSGTAGGFGGIAGDLLGLKSTSDVFVGVLTSRTAEDAIIEQFDLRKVYGDRRMEDVREDLAKHTSIGLDRKSQIITIEVTDKSPQRAAAIAQAYVEQLDRLVTTLSTSSARRERIFLEGRLKSVSQDLEAAEKDFSQFASKNTAINVPEQGKAMVEAAAVLQGQLIAAESEFEGLRQIYADDNVRVRSVRARIAELKLQLDKIGGKGEDSSATSAPSEDSFYPSIRRLPLLGVNYADLYRRTRVQEAVFESLTKEYELAKVQEVKEIPTVKVLDVANIPDKKSFPPHLLIMFLGTSLGCCLGVLYVLGSARWNSIDPQDSGKQFAREVWVDLKTHIPWTSRNGSEAILRDEGFLNEVKRRDE
jgi:uncharacterized protein involved in exopolysaccharide biosynthesis